MAVYEGERSPRMEVEVRQKAKRSADVDVEAVPNSKGPKLEVGQARPNVEDEYAEFFENLDDHPPYVNFSD